MIHVLDSHYYIHNCYAACIFCFIVTGVSAGWVNEGFTSLRVTLPEGGTYRISYLAVNKRNVLEPRVVTTTSSSLVVKDFRPDYFYTILVEAGNSCVWQGKQFPIVAMLQIIHT